MPYQRVINSDIIKNQITVLNDQLFELKTCKHCGRQFILGKIRVNKRSRTFCSCKCEKAFFLLNNKEKNIKDCKARRIKNRQFKECLSCGKKREDVDYYWPNGNCLNCSNAISEANKQKRKALIRMAGGSKAEYVLRKDVYKKNNGRCFYCNKKLQLINHKRIKTYITIDHYIPLSKGGDHVIDNCVPACWSCNSSKGNKII